MAQEVVSESDSDDEEARAAFEQKLAEKKKRHQQKKMSRQAISAEVFGAYNKKEEFKPKVVAKSPETKQQIRSLVEKIILFQCLNKEDISIVIDAMEEITVNSDETVIKEG